MKSLGRRTLFKRGCQAPGCPKFAIDKNQYCEDHQDLAFKYDKNRQSAYRRGYNHRWNKERKLFLSKHPWCNECLKQGILTPATVVDHTKAHKGDQTLFWDYDNWQSLCETCHNRKTAKEDMGTW